jgi:cytochrome-b5 reductase
MKTAWLWLCKLTRRHCGSVSARKLPMLTPSRVPRRAGIAFFVSLTCAASAYLFLPADTKPLSADHFTPSIVLANDDAGPDTKIITLKVKPTLVPLHFLRRSSPSSNGDPSIYSLFVKDSDIQVERPYTPLECADEEGKMRFWIKRYKNGEVGRWLHSRKQGDVVELRGPVTTWDWSWRPNDEGWDEIVMVGDMVSKHFL